jgi:hypothetical protein
MAEPSTKQVSMEEFLKGLYGFDRCTSIRAGRCVPAPIGCGKEVKGFKDMLSEKEFTISGLCQECQDKIFGSEE